jgi:putative tricarboxylic transport membrane protein
MTLGVPGSGTAAVMLGGLLLCGQQPGPLLFEPQPGIGWALIASLFLGNLACAVINFPLAGFLVRILSIPPKTFYPLVVVFSFLGLYTVNFSVTDLYLLAGMGFCGYLMKKFRVPTGPLVLASVIGDSVESSFRQSLVLSGGSPSIFFRSSISSGLLFAAALALAWPLVLDAWARRKEGKPAERPGE